MSKTVFVFFVNYLLICTYVKIFPWAANQEITNINVAVVDRDHSGYSQRLSEKIAASRYFNLTALSNTYTDAMDVIEADDADIILEIEPHFEKNLLSQGVAKVMISANAVDIMKGGLGSGYMANIVRGFTAKPD